jgi:hypothetical protein
MQGPTTFVPREWSSFFAALSSPERCDAAGRLCRKAVAQAQLALPEIDQAIVALATGHPEQPLIDQVQAIVDRLEAEYEALVGDDEGKLSCTEPPIKAAFVKARAAWAVKFALEGKLKDMAYEAWFVLDDLNQVRRLVGMQPPPENPPEKRRGKWWQFWAK